MLFPLLVVGYLISSLLLVGYSYTQVDLSLTITSSSVWQMLQKPLITIGFYERPLSTYIYLVTIVLLFILYGMVLFILYTKPSLLPIHRLWKLIIVVTMLLFFSYPAFSYDIFNYMFTAKTLLVYHKNPYHVVPLDFSGVEPWLSFMRWTHLPSAYPPLWIILSLPAYILGTGAFLPTLFSMKGIMVAAYLLTLWSIQGIMKHLDRQHTALSMAIFALNPLILIECLVSAHNDIVMISLGFLAMALWYRRQFVASWFMLSASVATKLITIILYPVALSGWRRHFTIIAMMIAFMSVGMRREILPWYGVWVIPFLAMVPNGVSVGLVMSLALGLLLGYAPYLYYGHWNDPVLGIKAWMFWMPISIWCISTIVWLFLTKRLGRIIFQ